MTMNLKKIAAFWNRQAEHFPRCGKVTPTSRDPFLGELERRQIAARLRPFWKVLELGCGDGVHSAVYARQVKKVWLTDPTVRLLDLAKRRFKREKITNAHFAPVSALNIAEHFRGQKFNAVISQRCLINLPDWRLQRQALLQIKELLLPGGVLLLSEGFLEPLERLSRLRRAVGLRKISPADYNCFFSRLKFESWIVPHFQIYDRADYGMYLLISRIYHPLWSAPREPRHDGRCNRLAFQMAQRAPLPSLPDYSYNLFYALRKKG